MKGLKGVQEIRGRQALENRGSNKISNIVANLKENVRREDQERWGRSKVVKLHI